MAIIEQTGIEDKWSIPAIFEKGGYQGYKIFLDRYTVKASREDIAVGDLVIVITKRDEKFPHKELGWVKEIGNGRATIDLWHGGEHEESLDVVSKPKEIYPEHVTLRAADALASCEVPAQKGFIRRNFQEVLLDKFVPGGRILAGAGVDELQSINCFVIPSPPDSRMEIIQSVGIMAETHSRGGGVGVNLSSMRPRFSKVYGVHGSSSGAVSWGELYSVETGLIEQGGSRRGATMLMIWDWHPDVFEFIDAKRKAGKYENVNMSVCISDDFMAAVKADADWDLIFPDTTYVAYEEEWEGDIFSWKENGYPVIVHKTVKAREIWTRLIESAWASAEPGLHFLERSNKMSNTHYFQNLVSTNPCGEQPLPAYGSCCLGAINMSKFVKEDGATDYENLAETIYWSVRMLDNVIDTNEYHMAEIEATHKYDRRIGLSSMGLGEYLIRKGLRYGSPECIDHLNELYEFFASTAYISSSRLAQEKGSFPGFDRDEFCNSGFMQTMPREVVEYIYNNGMRNACVLTQAPTGTTGTMVGTSTGIEPYYSWETMRTSRLGDHIEKVQVLEDLGLDINDLPDYCVTAQDLTPEEHLSVQAVLQRWNDSSISKTTNVPSTFTVEDTDKLYMLAYDMGCKGITMYRDGSRSEQVLNAIERCTDCDEVLIKIDGCVSCPNGCISKCML